MAWHDVDFIDCFDRPAKTFENSAIIDLLWKKINKSFSLLRSLDLHCSCVTGRQGFSLGQQNIRGDFITKLDMDFLFTKRVRRRINRWGRGKKHVWRRRQWGFFGSWDGERDVLQTILDVGMLIRKTLGVLDTSLDIDPPDNKDGDDHHHHRKDESPTGIIMFNDRSSDQRSQPRRGLVSNTVERKELGFFALGQQRSVQNTRERLGGSQHESKVDEKLKHDERETISFTIF